MTKTNFHPAGKGNKQPLIKIPELLAPAGSFDKLAVAILYGADAVYLAGSRYGMRARAVNFSDEELGRAVRYAHERKVQVYCTVNIFAHDNDFAGLPQYLELLGEIGVDGLIVADPGVIALARKIIPYVPIHLSTQANVTNTANALFWQEQGVQRLNLARELSLPEIAAVDQALDIEVEVFVHGAICISFSGRCLLSQYMTGRSANQGDCAQPCRYHYSLVEEKRPGEYFPVCEDERGTYLYNSKDLCLLRLLPDLLKTGVHSCKIEGRMKSVAYVGSAVRLYRAALDYLASHGFPHEGDSWPLSTMTEELNMLGSRGYTENFATGRADSDSIQHDHSRPQMGVPPAGIIRRGDDEPIVEARNPLEVGEQVEYLAPGLENYPVTIMEMQREETGETLRRANPNDRIRMKTSPDPVGWQEYGLLRKQKPDTNTL